MKEWILSHLSYILISIIAVFSPIVPMILTLFSLVLIDMVFAIYSAYKKNPSSVTSRKMGNTIGKLLIYISTIMVVYLVEKYILIDILPITKMVAGLISFVELKSIDETFNNLMGFSFYTGLINMIKRGASTTKDIVDEEK